MSGITPLQVISIEEFGTPSGQTFQCISFEPGYSKRKREAIDWQTIENVHTGSFDTKESDYHLGANGAAAAIMNIGSTDSPDYRLIGLIKTTSGTDPYRGVSDYSDINSSDQAWIDFVITGS